MEISILYAINGIHNNILDVIMVVITTLVDRGLLWIILAMGLLINKKTRKCGIFMLISMLLGFFIGNIIIKNVVARQRPNWIDNTINLLIVNPTDYSFPSGHTLVSFCSAMTIFLFNKKWGIFAIIFAILIGISRMYLFVHYPTDVLAGAILGIVISVVVFKVGNNIENRRGNTFCKYSNGEGKKD